MGAPKAHRFGFAGALVGVVLVLAPQARAQPAQVIGLANENATCFVGAEDVDGVRCTETAFQFPQPVQAESIGQRVQLEQRRRNLVWVRRAEVRFAGRSGALTPLPSSAPVRGRGARASLMQNFVLASATSLPVCQSSLGTMEVGVDELEHWRGLSLPRPDELFETLARQTGCFILLAPGEDPADPKQRDARRSAADFVITSDVSGTEQRTEVLLTLTPADGDAIHVAEPVGPTQPPSNLMLGNFNETERATAAAGAFTSLFLEAVRIAGARFTPGEARTLTAAAIYANPGGEGAAVLNAPAGALLRLIGADTGDWVKVVTADDARGWIMRNQLKIHAP